MQLEFPTTQQCIHSLMNIVKQAIGIIHQPWQQQNHPPCCFLIFWNKKKNLLVKTLTSFNKGFN
jgi:hypothetical protein